MESIRDRAAIIGMGCTKFGERWDADIEDLLVEAAYEAYADAGIDPKQIQAGWYGTQNNVVSGQPLTHALKLEYIPVTRCENFCCTGTDALRNACYAVAAGVYDIAIAAGVEKLKDAPYTGLAAAGSGPAGRDPTGVEPAAAPPVQFALLANRYSHHYKIPMPELKKALARIDVKNHSNGALNPKAHFQKEITMEQAINAPMVAYPLGLFDCCGVSDGSAVAIVTRPEIAKKLKGDQYILVKGLGLCCGAHQGTLQDDYDFVHIPENVAASKMAYADAGITSPLEQIDHGMVHDCFSITELLIMEDLGFAPRGKAPEYEHAGVFDRDGKVAINVDGGLKCFGHPIGGSGIRMVYEVWLQMLGRAGKRQRKNPTLGLTHNLGGLPGSFTCAVTIWGRGK